MRVLGIDPDLHNTGWALVDGDEVLAVGLVRIPNGLKEDRAVLAMTEALLAAANKLAWRLKPDRLVVESQKIQRQRTKNPNSIVKLAQVAGAALAAFGPLAPAIYLPWPETWKGSVPKGVHQARVCTKHHIKYDSKGSDKPVQVVKLPAYCDTFGQKYPKGASGHYVDAIGLADWGGKQP